MLKNFVFVLLALFASLPPLRAQSPTETAQGEAIVDRFIQVTGGTSAYAAVKSLITSGTSVYQLPGRADFTYRFVTYADRSDQRYTLLETPGGTKTEAGVSQGKAWTHSAQNGLRFPEAGDQAYAVRAAVFLAWSRWHDLYQSAAFVRAEGELDVVSLTPRNAIDPPVLNWYDRATGLHVRSHWTITTAKGPVVRRFEIGDYRKVAGIRIPFRLVLDPGPSAVTTQIELAATNDAIPASIFALPAAGREPVGDIDELRSLRRQIASDPLLRFRYAYADVFMSIQSERSCCSPGPDQLPRMEASIDRVIAKFRSVNTAGVPADLTRSWETLRDLHIAEQQALRAQVRFLAAAQAGNPRLRWDQDPRPNLSPAQRGEWDALVANLNRAASAAVASVGAFDNIAKKYDPR